MKREKWKRMEIFMLGLLTYVCWLALQLLLIGLLSPVLGTGLTAAEKNALLMLVADGLALCLLVPFCRHLRSLPDAFERPASRPFTGRSAAGLAALGLALQGGVDTLLLLMKKLAPELMAGYEGAMGDLGLGSFSLLPFLYVVCLAPAAEEFLFRGAAMGIWRKGFSFSTACLLQALLFGAAHADPVQGIYAFFLGFLLGAALGRYSSLKASILLHGVINLTGYLTSLFAAECSWSGLAMLFAGILLLCAVLWRGKDKPGRSANFSGIQGKM